MSDITRKSPYYDDYDSDKGYTQILAVPGNVEQAREFTQLGSMYKDFLGRLGDSVYKNGTIIDGCNISIHGTKANISSGRIYIDGLVRIVNGTVVDIKAVGFEVIGAKVESEIVTESHDITLLDPAQGYENYGQPGAHRLKESVKFVANDDSAVTLFRIQDGTLITSSSEGDQGSKMIDILAHRTYDENGNYKVNGLELQSQGKEDDQGRVLISVSDGKAYILGYEVVKDYSTIIPIDPSREQRTILSEPKVYFSNKNRYKLNNYPVVSIDQMTVDVEVTENITHKSNGSVDYLPHTPVISVSKVEAGSNVFTQGTDYQLLTDGIDWSLSGQEVPAGSTYKVTYKYTYTMINNTDFKTVNEGQSSYIEILPTAQVKPVPESRMILNYKFYLSRVDLILLDKLGKFSVIKGDSDISTRVESPINQDTTKLVIGTVLVTPDASTVSVMNYYTTRLDQAELYSVKRRVQDIEYNQALSDLDNEAIDSEQASSLKGIYTDGFIGLTKCDTSNDEFDCTIDAEAGELILPSTQEVIQLEVDEDNVDTHIAKFDKIVTAQGSETDLINQPKSTGTILVNPYSAYRPMCLVELTPSSDNWIDTSKIVVNDQKAKTVALRQWWYHRGASWADSEKRKFEALGIYNSYDKGTRGEQMSSKQVSSNSEVILDEAVMYMRQRKVQVSCNNFTPGEDNIECYFNNFKIPVSSEGTTVAGTQGGTVRADSHGSFSCSFTVPTNIPCGSVQVKFKGATSEGSAVYTSKGRKQVIRETIITTTTVVNVYDPVAQSFQFDEDSMLSSINLYFAAKDENKSITVQVRDMINGYPGNTLYYAQNVTPQEIKLSSDSSVATTIKFSKPVLCKKDTQYCICVLSDSALYQLYIAELGKKDLITKDYVVTQPYEAGLLFTSSNGLSWTAEQTKDLKYDLMRYSYSSDAVVMYKEVTNTNKFDRFVVAANTLDPNNTGVSWYYRASRAGTWILISPYTEVELPISTNYIQVKTVMNKSERMSPMLDISSASVVAISTKLTSTYVSRVVTMSSEFTKLKVLLEMSKPTGTDIHVYYQTNKDTSWVELTNPTVTKVTEVYNQYEFNKDNIQASLTYRVKIVMTTGNPIVKPKCRRLRSILKY